MNTFMHWLYVSAIASIISQFTADGAFNASVAPLSRCLCLLLTELRRPSRNLLRLHKNVPQVQRLHRTLPLSQSLSQTLLQRSLPLVPTPALDLLQISLLVSVKNAMRQ